MPVAIPVLSPQEVAHLPLGEPLFPGVMDPLDDCSRDTGHLKKVRHSGAVPKRVDGPSTLGREPQVVLHPLVSCNRSKRASKNDSEAS